MGTTIKRQPINFKIPNSPDYKYLNIMDFDGLNQTDNPFIAPSNSASECLNVYIDEENALTTRPRLKKHINLNHGDITHAHPIKDGFLINSTQGLFIYNTNTEKLFAISGGGLKTSSPWRVFENNEQIFILDGSNYYVIEDFVCHKVNGYIPTTKTGLNKKYYDPDKNKEIIDIYGVQYESFNLLTDKYKHSYFWDGTTNPGDVKGEVENLYRHQMYGDVYNIDSEFFKHIYDHPVDTDGNDFWMLGRCEDIDFTDGQNEIVYYKTTTLYEGFHDWEIQRMQQPENLPDHWEDGVVADCSSDGSVVAFSYWSNSYDTASTDTYGGLYVSYDKTIHALSTPKGTSGKFFTNNHVSDGFKAVRVSADGMTIVTYLPKLTLNTSGSTVTETWTTELLVFNRLNELSAYSLYKFDIDGIVCGIDLNDGFSNQNGMVVVYVNQSEQDVSCCEKIIFYDFNGDMSSPTITPTWLPLRVFGSSSLSYSGDLFAVESKNATSLKLENLLLLTPRKPDSDARFLPKIDTTGDVLYKFSKNNDKLYFWTNNRGAYTEPNGTRGWVMMDEGFTTVFDNFQDARDLGTGSRWRARAYEHYADTKDVVIFQSYGNKGNKSWCKTHYNYDSTEPLLIYTKTLTETDKYDIYGEETDYVKFIKLKQKFVKADTICRFENKIWFAKDKNVFYSAINDPTYIPLEGYNELGVNVNAFNVLDDSTLCVYGEDRLYVCYGVQINNKYTYSYAETINTQGNIAPDGCCVSPISVTPIHVGADGFYSLNQLKNVQSGERITNKISDNIIKIWNSLTLTDKRNIKNCVVKNWIVFYIPGKVTRMIVFDDRTKSWFYWEIALEVVNVINKTDILYVIGKNGVLYKFVTNDEINENNKQHEYYDDLNEKTLINWYWTSQILPLGTINYSKKLKSTTFVLTDNEEMDDYALNYKFKTFRKFTTETPQITISDDLNYIQSTTKRTLIPRFNFIQLQLSNEATNDIINDINHNKFRLVGLGLKYELLERLL